jgi:ribosome maturation factor RimP
VDFLQKIETYIEEPLQLEGYEVVRIQLTGSKRKVLQVMIDRLDGQGITLDDCSTVSHLVSMLLDQIDVIKDPFNLEVSSPGLDRPLTKPIHFSKYIGHEIVLQTHILMKNRKNFVGCLEKVGEYGITLKVDQAMIDGSTEIDISFPDIRQAKLKFEL